MAPQPHIVVLLGTGSTIGAGCEPEPPGDWNFFENPCVQKLLRTERYPALNWGVPRFDACSLEDLVAQTDLLAKLCASQTLSEASDYQGTFDSLWARGENDTTYATKLAMEKPSMALPALVAWEALSILCDVLDPKTLHLPKTSPLVTLLNVLLDQRSRLTLATLNYDLVLEQAVSRLGRRRAFRYGECEASPRTVEVLKLHGSLNWKEEAPYYRPTVPSWEARDWLKVVHPYASGSSLEQPSLLLPTLFKQEINIDYQTDPRAMHYKKLWEVFAARLSSATALLTVGCSFPDADWHLRVVVGSAVNAGNLRRVVVCVKKDCGPICRLKKIIDQAKKGIELRGEAGGLEALVETDKVNWLMQRA